VLLPPNAIPRSHKEHVAIFDAIRRRKPEIAREAMHAHLRAALHRYRVTGDTVVPALRAPRSTRLKDKRTSFRSEMPNRLSIMPVDVTGHCRRDNRPGTVMYLL